MSNSNSNLFQYFLDRDPENFRTHLNGLRYLTQMQCKFSLMLQSHNIARRQKKFSGSQGCTHRVNIMDQVYSGRYSSGNKFRDLQKILKAGLFSTITGRILW